MKTGTTALAAFLTKSARSGRLPDGLVYPVDEQLWPKEGAIYKHQALVAIGGVNPERTTSRQRVLREPEVVLDRLRSMVDVHRDSPLPRVTFFFVCEGAETYMDAPEFAKNLRAVFDEVEFVFVARDQVQSVASRLSHGIKVLEGEMVAPSRIVRFARLNLARGRFDLGRLVNRWGESLGAPLIVVPYFEDDIGTFDLIDRVLAACDLPRPPAEDGIEGRRIHPALTERALWVLWFYKRLYAKSRLPFVRAWALRAYETNKVRFHNDVIDVSLGATPWRPSTDQATAIREIYRESNDYFAQWLGERRTDPDWQRWFSGLRG